MVVVRPVADADVGLPLADEARDLAPVLERHHQLAVVVVEYLGLDAEDLGRLLRFRAAAQGQWPARDAPVADVAVGDGHALELVPGRGPLGGHPGRVELAIVGMGAERDDAQDRPRRHGRGRGPRRLRRGGRRGDEDEDGGEGGREATRPARGGLGGHDLLLGMGRRGGATRGRRTGRPPFSAERSAARQTSIVFWASKTLRCVSRRFRTASTSSSISPWNGWWLTSALSGIKQSIRSAGLPLPYGASSSLTSGNGLARHSSSTSRGSSLCQVSSVSPTGALSPMSSTPKV